MTSLILVVADLSNNVLNIPRQVLTWTTNGMYSAMNSPGRWIGRSSQLLQDRAELLDQIDDLVIGNQDLTVQNQRLESLVDANAELRRLLALEQTNRDISYVAAELTGTVFEAGRSEIFISRGTRHGVQSGMPVIDSSGVYGQVVEALPYTSRVILVTDQRIAIPVIVQRSGHNGVATGLGNSSELTMEHSEVTADVEPGDLLVTSGMAGVYPYGYPVGVVTEVESDESGVGKHVLVQPLAEMNRRNWLLVVIGISMDETAEE